VKIKVFKGNSVSEVLQKVKETLGEDALILSVKRTKRGKKIEALAAMDDPSYSWSIQKTNAMEHQNELLVIKREMELLRRDINFLQESLEKIAEGFAPLGSFIRLASKGVKGEIIEIIADSIKNILSNYENIPSEAEVLKHIISSVIQVMPPLETTEPKIAFFIGPTGTGKTASVAKLAFLLKNMQRKVQTATLDAGLGAQILRHYLKDLNLTTRCFNSVSDLEKWAKRKKESTLLIDTPGINPFKSQDIEYIKKISSCFPQAWVYLVLDTNMNEDSMKEITKALGHDNFSGYLFTKVDESLHHGVIFNRAVYTKKPLSYLGTGKELKNIETASADKITQIMLHGLS